MVAYQKFRRFSLELTEKYICYIHKCDLGVASYVDAFDRSVIAQKTLIVSCVHLIIITRGFPITVIEYLNSAQVVK